MSNDYDIEMTTDDTLELDTIIEQIDNNNSITKVDEGNDYNINVIETQTEIFDPTSSGEYKVNINGQILSINVKDASAVSNKVIDHFEEILYQDQNRILNDVYSGDLSSGFTRNQNIIQEGSYSLKVGDTSGNNSGAITDTDNLNQLNQEESVECYSRGESTGGVTRGPLAGFLFAVQSESGFSNISFYVVNVRYRYNSLGIKRFDSGSSQSLYNENNGDTPLPSQKWHKCRLDWESNGDIRFRVYDSNDSNIFDKTVNDTTYTDGGIGWIHRSDDRNKSGAAWIDNARIL
jgi:hypothetical protein